MLSEPKATNFENLVWTRHDKIDTMMLIKCYFCEARRLRIHSRFAFFYFWDIFEERSTYEGEKE